MSEPVAVAELDVDVAEELKRRISTFLRLFDTLRKKSRWPESSLNRTTSLSMALARRRLDTMEEFFPAVSALVQSNDDFLPSLSPTARFACGTIILAAGEEPKRALREISRIDSEIQAQDFEASDPTTVAAVILFLGGRGKSVGAETVQKATSIYQTMRERRWMTSGENDLPMAALLTSSQWDVDTIDERVRDIDAALTGKNTRSVPVETRRFIAHVLTLSRYDEDVVVRRFFQISEARAKADLEVTPQTPEETALLCLVPTDVEILTAGFQRVVRCYRSEKKGRFAAAVLSSLCTGTVLGACLERGQLLGEGLNIGLLHSFDILLQSQAAALAGFGSAHLVADENPASV